jgi:hypothetical protein
MSDISDRDQEWKRALRPPGFAPDAWDSAGPRNPEEARVFVEETARAGDEYSAALRAELELATNVILKARVVVLAALPSPADQGHDMQSIRRTAAEDLVAALEAWDKRVAIRATCE